MNPQANDKLDQLLDGGLARYGDVEPLAGLEERVLGRLSQPEPQRRNWWVWVAASAALATLALVVLWSTRPRPGAPPLVKHEAPAPAVHPPEHPLMATTPQPVPPRHVRPRMVPVQTATSKEPRLATFPAPSEPTEQERLLLRYARMTSRVELVQMAEANELPPLPKADETQNLQGNEQLEKEKR